MRECGLKQSFRLGLSRSGNVTPHAGVWIETKETQAAQPVVWSLPMRECGLKQR